MRPLGDREPDRRSLGSLGGKNGDWTERSAGDFCTPRSASNLAHIKNQSLAPIVNNLRNKGLRNGRQRAGFIHLDANYRVGRADAACSFAGRGQRPASVAINTLDVTRIYCYFKGRDCQLPRQADASLRQWKMGQGVLRVRAGGANETGSARSCHVTR